MANKTAPTLSLADLSDVASRGTARFLFLGVALGSGQRLGVDRDRDGAWDRDEVLAGTIDTDPDQDGDGLWDGELPLSHPPRVTSWTLDWVTTNSAKISYRTDALSPTHLNWSRDDREIGSYGDPIPLSTGPGSSSKRWKRDHTAFVRVTDPAKSHRLTIVTQSQLGATGAWVIPLGDVITDGDRLDNSYFVQELELNPQKSMGGTTRWSAKIRVEGENFQSRPSARVFARFSFFDSSDVIQSQVVARSGIHIGS